MIVQAPEREGGPAFVILQNDHTAFAGQLADHFGNDVFEPLVPAELVTELVSWHDEGWTELDKRFLRNPETGLPYDLVRTPFNELVRTSELSPEMGEKRHPFIGLLTSMHTCGLYTGRQGLADMSVMDVLPQEARPQVERILDNEAKRQTRLTNVLKSDPGTESLTEPSLIRRTYNALQFFDLFALYVQCEHPSRHDVSTFPGVPVNRDPADDVTITATPLGSGRYQLEPFPFDQDPFKPSTAGRYVEPQPAETDLSAVWAASEPAQQQVILVS